MDARYLPAGLEGRAAAWRARMAGKRMLLILDNAASSGQVAPLLPGAAGCLVLVTSRRYLGDLPAALMPMPLDTLPSEDAQAMFITLAPRAKAGPDLVADMAGLCGCLPLAITLLAGLFARHRSWDMAYLIDHPRRAARRRAARRAGSTPVPDAQPDPPVRPQPRRSRRLHRRAMIPRSGDFPTATRTPQHRRQRYSRAAASTR
jgi:hypothetical protein